jgi:hypothetical protein
MHHPLSNWRKLSFKLLLREKPSERFQMSPQKLPKLDRFKMNKNISCGMERSGFYSFCWAILTGYRVTDGDHLFNEVPTIKMMKSGNVESFNDFSTI